jgi:hypothetical protein
MKNTQNILLFMRMRPLTPSPKLSHISKPIQSILLRDTQMKGKIQLTQL